MTLTSATSTTQAVVHHHLERFVALDLQGVLADYAPDAVMIVPTGVLRGVQEITPLFQNLLAEFAKNSVVSVLHKRSYGLGRIDNFECVQRRWQRSQHLRFGHGQINHSELH